MARTITGAAQLGNIKSIQHITGNISVNGTVVNVTISAVDTSNSIIVSNSEFAGEYGDDDSDGRTWGTSSSANAVLTSTTNVQLDPPNLDQFANTYGDRNATFYGSVIEYEL